MSLNPSGSSTRAELLARHLAEVQRALSQIDARSFGLLADELLACWARGGTVHVLGNGGSEANAAHAVLHLRDVGIRAHDILAESAWLTAMSNDYGYRTAGQKYIRVNARAGDALLAISGSGNSVNVVDALELAGRSGIRRLGLLGFGGGEAAQLCDAAVTLTSNLYGPVEDAHSAVIHALQSALLGVCSPVDLRARV